MVASLRSFGSLSACLLLGLAPGVCAAAPPAPIHDLQGFYHMAWSSDSGLGGVYDIQQGPDGFLWLTTSTGIFRFDGVRFQSMDEATNGAAHNQDLDAVFLAADGGVWFNTRNAGLDLWKDNKLVEFPDRRCTPARKSGGIVEDKDGSLWILASASLVHLTRGDCEQIGSERGYPGGLASAFAMDRTGTLWVKMRSGELLFLPRGEQRFKLSPHGCGPIMTYDSYLHEAPDGAVWLSDNLGLRRVTDRNSANDAAVAALTTPHTLGTFGDFTFAADGSLWAANAAGVLRFTNLNRLPTDQPIDPAEGDSYTPAHGLSSDVVWKLLIDREGSLWIATNAGLDQLRRNAVSSVALPHIKQIELAIAAGENGSVWIGSRLLPLTRIAQDGKLTTYPETGSTTCLRRDPGGVVWAAGRGKAAFLWRISGNTLVPVHYPNEAAEIVTSLAVDGKNVLWISTWGPVIERLVGKIWENQNQAVGRKPGLQGAMRGDDAGNVWIAFSNNLVEWDGSAYRHYSFANNLAVSVATIAIRDGRVWMGGAGGVMLFQNGQFHLMRWSDESQVGKVSGLVETRAGELWINGFSGVTRVSATELAKWLKDPNYAVSAERLNALDGLPGLSEERYPEPSIVESPDGRVWFATAKGVGWVDPKTLNQNRNRLPPPVTVSTIVANGRPYVGLGKLTLPAHTQNLEIDYTALSLAIPERVLFRYKLDGVDQGWQDVGTRRQAYYTKLRPGRYRFHVIACNNEGVWNDTGANVAFAIAPAWYQTTWFLAVCAALAFVILLALYRMRVHQVAKAIHARFDERLAERTRIARDLHDTFLQTVQGSKLVADDALDPSTDPVRMRRAMDQISVWLGRATEEGRAALNSLRTSTTEKNDLAEAFRRAIEECRMHSSIEASFSVAGASREMHPIVRDEVYRIGYEAIRNACLHSNAKQLKVELTYTEDLALDVRDDGVGIDPVVVARGREGHFGLQGMRERAARIAGELTVASSPGSGTEVKLVVPGKIIYRRTAADSHHM